MDQTAQSAESTQTQSPSSSELTKRDNFHSFDGISFASVDDIKNPPVDAISKPVYKAEEIAFSIKPSIPGLITKNTQWLLASSCTQTPYFALKNLEIVSEKTVKASIPIETENADEAGIITAAEVGRHLAILGTCAANLIEKNGTKNYFLATHAELNILDDFFFEKKESELTAVATAFEIDKRKTQSKVNLFCGNKRIFTLSVTYHILSEKIFQKLFDSHRIENVAPPENNPYISPIIVDTLYLSSTELFAQLKKIEPSHCLGHFNNYPALPVAVVMGNLSHCAGLLLQKLENNESKYQISYADVTAENLAFANDIISIKISLLEKFDHTYIFACNATNQNNLSTGKMILEMKVLGE